MPDTNSQFNSVLTRCRDIFEKKLADYGPSWRVMRPVAITDQLFIKAKRIRKIQISGTSKVNEGITPEFVALVNYGIIAIIQLQLPPTVTPDIDNVRALELYDTIAANTKALMLDKNHDYDEAWRDMRVDGITDIILTKLLRIREIEEHNGRTIISEGVDSNYQDIINYAIFSLIKLTE